ncbi:IDEAL domain-containing protein [Paenibacillus durus]|uniref:IDEAL domain-containing protein n=1 Tax=Paenibacillus durus ATCC 35681 TaxID=1333534 RepID=A0A0F7FCP0_PAEDU|nr:IDEAL domain-containing protein [Paenibacillus durus]AKG36119.1 hypothetical protein VK70_17420 [Paenibacillus durus ATCC 35681]
MFFISRSIYELILDANAEAVLEQAIRRFRWQQLLQKIDDALDRRDERAFYEYSAELIGLGNDD